MTHAGRLVSLCLAAMIFATGALIESAAAADPPSWGDLPDSVQEVLKQHRGSWDGYSSRRRHQLLSGAYHYLAMTPEQQRAFRERAKRFESMPASKRKKLCDDFFKEHGYRPKPCN